MATKSVSKSIRITPEVFAYIDQAPGEGFNDKLENIILEAKHTERERRKRLANLQEQIEEEQRKLRDLFNRYRYLEDFFRSFIRMQHQLSDLEELLNKTLGQGQQTIDD